MWIGHVVYGLKGILEGRIKGKKQSGRPRCRTQDWMKKRQWLHISEFERDFKVSNYVEKLVPETCPRAENLEKEKTFVRLN